MSQVVVRSPLKELELADELCLLGAPAGGAVPSSALGLTSMGTGPNSGERGRRAFMLPTLGGTGGAAAANSKWSIAEAGSTDGELHALVSIFSAADVRGASRPNRRSWSA
jgi:hypothetical protein